MQNKLYIYKIFSIEHWDKCLQQGFVLPLPNDKEFIHLCSYTQIEKILAKFWQNIKSVCIAKIDPTLLKGQLVFESNVVGGDKYYHLYNGNIPIDAIINLEIR